MVGCNILMMENDLYHVNELWLTIANYILQTEIYMGLTKSQLSEQNFIYYW
jgi:hypothetical protein